MRARLETARSADAVVGRDGERILRIDHAELNGLAVHANGKLSVVESRIVDNARLRENYAELRRKRVARFADAIE